jgi:hypothetical protein
VSAGASAVMALMFEWLGLEKSFGLYTNAGDRALFFSPNFQVGDNSPRVACFRRTIFS